MRPLCKDNNIENKKNVPNSLQTNQSVEKSVEDWTYEDVNKWLNDLQVDKTILDSILPCNGKLLKQYYEMQCSCPEFFYSSISSNNKVSFRNVASFGCELKNIFKK